MESRLGVRSENCTPPQVPEQIGVVAKAAVQPITVAGFDYVEFVDSIR